MLLDLRSNKLNAIDKLCVTVELSDNFPSFKLPYDDLGILPSTCNEPITFADVNVGDIVKVSVE